MPLVVDLDGTLIHSDLLWEVIALFARRRFLRVWILPLWLFPGKAGFKAKLAAALTLPLSGGDAGQPLLALLGLALSARDTRLLLAASF